MLADSASKPALNQAAGDPTENGVNYVVSTNNLTSNPGVSISILSHYTLDGNVTANGGTLSTGSNSVLGGNTNVTLSGSSGYWRARSISPVL